MWVSCRITGWDGAGEFLQPYLWGWEENPALGQGWEEENPALGPDWEENPALGPPEQGLGAAGACAEHSLGTQPAWKPLEGDKAALGGREESPQPEYNTPRDSGGEKHL